MKNCVELTSLLLNIKVRNFNSVLNYTDIIASYIATQYFIKLAKNRIYKTSSYMYS